MSAFNKFKNSIESLRTSDDIAIEYFRNPKTGDTALDDIFMRNRYNIEHLDLLSNIGEGKYMYPPGVTDAVHDAIYMSYIAATNKIQKLAQTVGDLNNEVINLRDKLKSLQCEEEDKKTNEKCELHICTQKFNKVVIE